MNRFESFNHIPIEYGWRNVDEKVPEDFGYYLCYTKEKKIEILRFDGHVGVVTHWMPLPSPPKGINESP